MSGDRGPDADTWPEPASLIPEAGEPGASVAPATLVTNSAWLLASRLIGIAAAGVLSVYAIRSLSVAEWGRYSTIISLGAVFAVVTEAGLSSLTLRELSAKPEHERSIVATALSAAALTGAVSLTLMCATAWLLGYWAYPGLVVLAAAILVFQAAATPLFAIFNAHRVLVYPAVMTAVAALLAAGVGIVLVAVDVGPASLLIGSLAAQILAGVAGYVVLRRRFDLRPRPRRPDATVRRFILTALPIAATGGLTIVYQRVDILMLSQFSTERAVAIYSVPFSLVQYSWMVPQVVAAAYFPLLARSMQEDRAEAERSFFLIVRLFFFLSLPLTLFLVVGGGPLMSGIFGSEYAESADVLAIMAWISVLGFQNYVLWYGILACHREKQVVVIQAAGLAINVALNIVLIPAYGPEGAAVALLASDFVVVAGQAVVVHRHVFRIPWQVIFARPLLAALLIVPVVLLLRPVSTLAAAAAGGLVYAAILFATQYVTWEEWRPLREPLAALGGRLRGTKGGTP